MVVQVRKDADGLVGVQVPKRLWAAGLGRGSSLRSAIINGQMQLVFQPGLQLARLVSGGGLLT